MTTTPKPPADLGAPGRRLWRAINETHELDHRELAILHEAARQADSLDALAAVLTKQGYTTVGASGQDRLHPAVSEARQGRLALGRLLDLLHLPDDEGQARVNRPQSRRASRRWGSG